MNIQIFGTKKSKETQKATRFFKERRISFQEIDLSQKAISKGELNSIKRSNDISDLIDTESKQYEKLNLKYISHDTESMLLEHPLLFRMPIVRNGNDSTVGYKPEKWQEWINESK